ncbi:MAG: excinuclease ABC subunit UvrC [Deltaproteobacteria bacterium]|nr:excinuclease ABC subunit UvrC [Deltaproteobacteria bacterium]
MSELELEDQRLNALREEVRKLPKLPGVYVMRDRDDAVIYVGKAIDLRARVMSYFLGGDGRSQIEYLMQRVYKVDKFITENEEQALALERDLINKYKPRYNIRLKDDKAYINVRIDKNAEWPRLELVRKVENDGAVYFGPYTASHKLYGLLEVIRNVVPLRSCSDTVFYNRQRPCLEYQIKRCAGPCCLTVDSRQYEEWVEQAIAMLQGKLDEVIEELTGRMEQASEKLNFEEAAVLRDRVEALEEYKRGAQYVQHHGERRDVFGLYREGALATLCIMKVRNGRISDSDSFSFTEVRVPDSEVIESALLQYYEGDREIPEEIVIPVVLQDEKVLKQALSKRRGAAVNFTLPLRGSKLRLLQLANVNAGHGFISRFNSDQRYQEISRELSLRFALGQVPRRIECVDISNLQGSDIVGALVSFFDGSPDKSSYKRYRIRFQGKPDDFQAIQEVVTRRLTRGKEEEDLPDLLIIDGGLGQLQRAVRARDELEIKLDIIALAKERLVVRGKRREQQRKPERVFVEGASIPVSLNADDPVSHFLQRVRDEAHRFVISYHRGRRAKRVFRSVLDEVSGLGPQRRARLLRHFGSIKRIGSAEIAEIAKAGRMPASLAAKVKQQLSK